MTILTKPFSEKKSDKAVAPLVDNEQLPPPLNASGDVEGQPHVSRILVFPSGVGSRHFTALTTLCLLLTALTVVGIGIAGGKVLYDQYLRVAPAETDLGDSRFEGWAQIPMSKDSLDETMGEHQSDDADVLIDKMFPTENYPDIWNDDKSEFKKLFLKDFFQENFQIDDDKKYEKIDVPDFRDGRSGRFIHDFNTNTTGIIDITGHRCFVMPLNRDDVLPPKSLFDLIHKMWEGYYKVNTALVRRDMRVVLPPITDTKSIGGYIANECDGLPIYRLEKFVGGVVKRSVKYQSDVKFADFAGKGISQIEIMNIDDVIDYEKNLKSH
ncbi:unnamed protein product [Phyllotreta striolata]|uniref:Integral membrane protein 2 n=1 Tax=Phyllotreta striolata TaxID=444603 RepID=A0A9N9XRY1_PHYSR|nr:unnamed protein product [Phyllotreta striolata]